MHEQHTYDVCVLKKFVIIGKMTFSPITHPIVPSSVL